MIRASNHANNNRLFSTQKKMFSVWFIKQSHQRTLQIKAGFRNAWSQCRNRNRKVWCYLCRRSLWREGAHRLKETNAASVVDGKGFKLPEPEYIMTLSTGDDEWCIKSQASQDRQANVSLYKRLLHDSHKQTKVFCRHSDKTPKISLCVQHVRGLHTRTVPTFILVNWTEHEHWLQENRDRITEVLLMSSSPSSLQAS